MTMVKFCRSSSISSSIFAVAMGSSAEQGSSIRMTSGLTAMARAMQRRCCWPPESPVRGSFSRSLTSLIEELIDELRENYTIVIVTHSMQQAARVSQRTAFFHLGTLVEWGETEQIFTMPNDERTQGYITGRFG